MTKTPQYPPTGEKPQASPPPPPYRARSEYAHAQAIRAIAERIMVKKFGVKA